MFAWASEEENISNPTRSTLLASASLALVIASAWAQEAGSPTTSEQERVEQPMQTQTETETRSTYTVRRGDTISGIARQHGVTVRELAEANGLRNANQIRSGQELTIPARTRRQGQARGQGQGQMQAEQARERERVREHQPAGAGSGGQGRQGNQGRAGLRSLIAFAMKGNGVTLFELPCPIHHTSRRAELPRHEGATGQPWGAFARGSGRHGFPAVG